jgi:thioredoxin reductase
MITLDPSEPFDFMQQFEVIIIGGSYAGLSAALSLGRAVRRVLIIDGGKPCNIQTPFSHNFLTRDGETPLAIAAAGKEQVLSYPTVEFVTDEVLDVSRGGRGFEVITFSNTYTTGKLIFATGMQDMLPETTGFADCWGISIVHCPYCHGYEIKDTATAVLGNGDTGMDFVRLINHWTQDISLLTNGPAILTDQQREYLADERINLIEKEIAAVVHTDGHLQAVMFDDGSTLPLNAMYARFPMAQRCSIPEQLGCVLSEQGLIQVDEFQKTNVEGIYAVGDCTSQMRSVANAVATGSKAGAALNNELIRESRRYV